MVGIATPYTKRKGNPPDTHTHTHTHTHTPKTGTYKKVPRKIE